MQAESVQGQREVQVGVVVEACRVRAYLPDAGARVSKGGVLPVAQAQRPEPGAVLAVEPNPAPLGHRLADVEVT